MIYETLAKIKSFSLAKKIWGKKETDRQTDEKDARYKRGRRLNNNHLYNLSPFLAKGTAFCRANGNYTIPGKKAGIDSKGERIWLFWL